MDWTTLGNDQPSNLHHSYTNLCKFIKVLSSLSKNIRHQSFAYVLLSPKYNYVCAISIRSKYVYDVVFPVALIALIVSSSTSVLLKFSVTLIVQTLKRLFPLNLKVIEWCTIIIIVLLIFIVVVVWKAADAETFVCPLCWHCFTHAGCLNLSPSYIHHQ